MHTVEIHFDDRQSVIECVKTLIAKWTAIQQRNHDEYVARYEGQHWLLKKFWLPKPGLGQNSPTDPAYAFSPLRPLESMLKTLERPRWHTISMDPATYLEIMAARDAA